MTHSLLVFIIVAGSARVGQLGWVCQGGVQGMHNLWAA